MRRAAHSRLLAGAFLLAVILSACGGEAGPSQDINGAGTTFPAPFYGAAFQEFAQESGIQVSYQPIGSSEGQQQFIQREVAFGASTTPLSEAQEQEAGGNPLHIATVGGAVGAAYNLEGVDTLNLTGSVLADIFLGNITDWDDPEIAGLNPEARLPDAPIAVVYRSDGSGTTAVFTNYLAAVSPEWQSGPGAGEEVGWPVGSGVGGNEGIAGRIGDTPNSIGYVAYEYAVENDLRTASLGEAGGGFVEPSVAGARAAIEAARIPKDLKVMISSTNPQGDGVYPITGLTWLLVRQQMEDPAECRAVAKAAWYLTHDAQVLASYLTYVRIPTKIVSRNEEFIRSMEAQGQPCYDG